MPVTYHEYNHERDAEAVRKLLDHKQVKLPLAFPRAQHHSVIAVSNEEIVGFSTVKRAPNGKWVLYVAVHPKHRKTGIGTNLTTEVLEVARSKGITTVETDAAENNTAAKRLAKKTGFKETEPESAGSGRVSYIIMVRKNA